MGRIIAVVDMSLDGYYDRMDEWFDPEDESRTRISDELIWAADAALIGRQTFEALSDFWPKKNDDFAQRVNSMPKYVASRTVTGDLDWNSTLLDGPVEKAVRALKERHHLLVSWGFGELGETLIQAGLLDELQVFVYPFVCGSGEQKFTSSAFRLHTTLVRALPSGAVGISYRPEALQTSEFVRGFGQLAVQTNTYPPVSALIVPFPPYSSSVYVPSDPTTFGLVMDTFQTAADDVLRWSLPENETLTYDDTSY